MTRATMPCPCERPCASGLGTLGLAPERVRIRRTQKLWEQGDTSDCAVIVCAGAVCVTSTTPEGQEQVVCLATRGFTLGFDEVLDGSRRVTGVEVLMAGSVIVLQRARIEETLHRGGPNALRFASLAARGSRLLARRVRELSYGTVEQRLARLLLHLCEDAGISDARGMLVPVQMSRTRLALALGCRSETLVRTINAPPFADAVQFEREGIRVPDVEALRRLSSAS